MYYYYLHNWPSDRSLLSGHLWFQSYALKFKRMNEHQNMWNKMIKAKASIKKYNFKDGFEKIVHSCCTEGVSGIKILLIPRCLFNAESCVQKHQKRPRWATEDDILCHRPPNYIHGTAYLGAARNASAGFPRHHTMPNLQCPVYAVHITMQMCPSSLMTWWICYWLCVRLLVHIIVCYYMSGCH